MNKKRVLGFALVFGGLLLFFLKPLGSITGFAIAENISSFAGIWAYVFGLSFMLLGAFALYEPDYYKRRAKEITSYKDNVWVCQSEIEGVLQELINRGYRIEHGKNSAAIHTHGEAPFERHVGIEKKGVLRKNIFITDDPQDERLRQIGTEVIGERINRVRSRAYNPNHPVKRVSNPLTDRTEINY